MLQFSKHKILARTHVLKMAMLSQRAVDYSVKAYALNSSELCREVIAMKSDLCKLELCIRNRGRTLLAAGAAIDSYSQNACSLLRIYSSLRVVFAAATEIAQNATVLVAEKRMTAFPRTVENGESVNFMVRLCAIALFEEQAQIAETVLRIDGDRRGFDLALRRARQDVLLRPDTHRDCQLAISNCIEQIVEQVYEIAESTIAWIESNQYIAEQARVLDASRSADHRVCAEEDCLIATA